MVEIIASIALIGGIAGAGSIIARKMPQAVKTLEVRSRRLSGRCFFWA